MKCSVCEDLAKRIRAPLEEIYYEKLRFPRLTSRREPPKADAELREEARQYYDLLRSAEFELQHASGFMASPYVRLTELSLLDYLIDIERRIGVSKFRLAIKDLREKWDGIMTEASRLARKHKVDHLADAVAESPDVEAVLNRAGCKTFCVLERVEAC